MAEPFLGEIRMFSFNFPPKGWAFCNGQILAINTNTALFSLLGTQYGGNGQTTFALPNLQGHVALDTDFANYPQGSTGGEQAHTLTVPEMPAHTHQANCYSGGANSQTPGNNVWARDAASLPSPYSTDPPTLTMDAGGVTPAGGGQPHDNMQPYLVITFCIALVGIFPSRN